MNFTKPTVYFIESNSEIRNATVVLLASRQIPCELFGAAEDFLHRFDPRLTGCIVSEVFLPAMSGMELLRTVVDRSVALPVILSSSGADVRMAVEAMRCGAMSFLEKPYSASELTEAIQAAFRISARMQATYAQHAEIQRRFDQLVPRERQIAELVVEGKTNKCISRILGACERTVERLRAKVFETMGVDSAPQLARVLANMTQHNCQEIETPQRVYQAMPAHTLPLRPLAWPIHSLQAHESVSRPAAN